MNVSKDVAAIRKMAAELRREAGTLAQREAPRILKAVQDVTPPANGSVKLSAGIARGRARVRSDVYRVAVPRANGEQAGSLESLMREHRVKGRVPARLNPRHEVPWPEIQQYISTREARVGALARAWEVEVAVDGRGTVTIRVWNTTPYATAVEGLEVRVDKLMEKRLRRMERALMGIMLRAGKAAGLKVS
ncbi:hypothetical protein [Verrucomicrobium spinosum]|uniref:hypothetical protein n=1 Tax=Verrucomicrobium spinosum TaxID=2736 RepID=UPI0001746667|nr:hypothetical protein [Verrucomicrobium spinosum]